MRRIGAALLALAIFACLPAAAAAAASAPPAIQYLSPQPLRNHEATLHFTVNPEGLDTSWELEYGKEAGKYFPNFEIRRGELPAGTEPVALQVKVPAFFEGGLAAATEYHWRVVAENSAGKTEGPDETFTTTNGVPPVPWTAPATDVTQTSAVMHGTVDPVGTLLTSCRFHVVPEVIVRNKGWSGFDTIENEPFGVLVPCVETLNEIGDGSRPVRVHATVTGLAQEPYEFRVEAANEYEDGKYPAAEWIEPSAPPVVDPILPTMPPVPPSKATNAPQLTAGPALRRKHRHAKHRRLHRNASISAVR